MMTKSFIDMDLHLLLAMHAFLPEDTQADQPRDAPEGELDAGAALLRNDLAVTIDTDVRLCACLAFILHTNTDKSYVYIQIHTNTDKTQTYRHTHIYSSPPTRPSGARRGAAAVACRARHESSGGGCVPGVCVLVRVCVCVVLEFCVCLCGFRVLCLSVPPQPSRCAVVLRSRHAVRHSRQGCLTSRPRECACLSMLVFLLTL
jgi:hypothetical protein